MFSFQMKFRNLNFFKKWQKNENFVIQENFRHFSK
jgi:hypothetical protein